MSDSSSLDRAGRPGFVSRHAWAPYLLLTMTVLFFAGNHVIGRAVRDDIPPLALTFWRSFIAFALLMPFVASRVRAQLPLVLKCWKLMVLLGFTQLVTGQALVYYGLHTTTAVNSGMIQSTRPALVMLVAWLLLRDRITLRQGAGLLIAFFGAVAIILRGDMDTLFSLNFVVGDLWVQLAILNFAFYMVVLKWAPAELEPVVLFQALTFAGLVFLAPLYAGEILFTEGRIHWSGATVLAILYTAVFASILALIFLNVGIAHVGPGKAGMFMYLTPVVTASLAVTVLDEPLHRYHLLGVALVLSGVYLATRARAKVAA